MTKDERCAVALYAVGARDPFDFIDMIADESTSVEALSLLRDMLAAPGTEKTDKALNALLLPMVEQQLAKRRRTD